MKSLITPEQSAERLRRYKQLEAREPGICAGWLVWQQDSEHTALYQRRVQALLARRPPRGTQSAAESRDAWRREAEALMAEDPALFHEAVDQEFLRFTDLLGLPGFERSPS